jgi:hypothetical protein
MKKILICAALICTGAIAEPNDPTKKDNVDIATDAIGEKIIKPLQQDFTDRIMRNLQENNGAMAPSAKKYLEKRKIEEQIAYDRKMRIKHAAIMEAKRCKKDCKPRPIQECMKPNYTIDDDVIGCSKGEITKSW